MSHKEAFALMWYACAACRHRERIWNSRDGVTPYGGVPCPSCGASLRHVDWHEDDFQPNHQLRPGQRFWRDGTRADAVAAVARLIAAYERRGIKMPLDAVQHIQHAAESQTGDWKFGWPKLDQKAL